MRARDAGTPWSPTWSVPDFIGIFLLKMNNIILWFLLNNNKKNRAPIIHGISDGGTTT